ncbi:MAG: RICIN domain-containing protein [Cyanobacteria bacterium P01_H01_bin.130]
MLYSSLLAILTAALPPPIATAGAGAPIQIRNLSSGRCLDVPGGQGHNHLQIQQYECRQGGDTWVSAQLWQLNKIGDYVQIQNPRSGRCLDVPDGRAENHITIQQYDCRNRGDRWLSAQLWELERLNGYVQIRNLRTGLCLDMPLGKSDNHLIVQQYTCRDVGDRWLKGQLWELGR